MGGSFTIVALPDTQYYCQTYPLIFDNQTQWIVDNKELYNIVFVTHEGDIVQNWNNAVEWDRADHSMSILDGTVPYGMLPGNHDQEGGSPTGSTYLYNFHFGYTRYQDEDWYGGHYGGDNDNNFELVSVNGMRFLILHLEYNATDDTLAWANDVLELYDNRRAIVDTHYFLNPSGIRCSIGDRIFNALKNNNNLFLILCGHLCYTAHRTDLESNHKIHQVLTDYQDQPNGGNGWLRLFTFQPDEDNILVQTYSTYLDEFGTGESGPFNLAYNMGSIYIDIANDIFPDGHVQQVGDLTVKVNMKASVTNTTSIKITDFTLPWKKWVESCSNPNGYSKYTIGNNQSNTNYIVKVYLQSEDTLIQRFFIKSGHEGYITYNTSGFEYERYTTIDPCDEPMPTLVTISVIGGVIAGEAYNIRTWVKAN